MKKPKIFLDTTIISYLFKPDKPEKETESNLLWEHIIAGEYEVVLSNEVLREINNCEEPKRQKMNDMLKKIEYVEIKLNSEIVELANEIIRLGILKEKNRSDSLHIACAIYSNCDQLISWNFSDLVNPKTVMGIWKMSLLYEWSALEIISPFSLRLREEK